MDFYKFWDKMNGKPYQKTAPPVKYEFASYLDAITTNPLNGGENNSTHELIPLTQDDMCRYGAEDVADWLKNHGTDTYKLGKPMSDEEFKKHHGNPH